MHLHSIQYVALRVAVCVVSIIIIIDEVVVVIIIMLRDKLRSES